MKHDLKRKHLIKKLFKVVVKETIDNTNIPIKLRINARGCGRSYCRTRFNTNGGIYSISIVLDLRGIEKRIKEGYLPAYYDKRPQRLNRYIIKNRHNALRFLLYHELRHAYQRIYNINRDSIYQKEFDADSWALAHLKIKGGS
jgi:hypothetical protein